MGEMNPGVFDIWEGFNSLGSQWVDGIKDGIYKPDVQTDNCINYLQQFSKQDRPFIMIQSYYPPHHPFTAPKEIVEEYRKKGILFPGYYAAVNRIDYNVGRIMKALEETGLKESTLVIYTSDHGDFVGHHGMVEKNAIGQNVYEDILNVPLIIKYPGKTIKGNALPNWSVFLTFIPPW